MDVLLDEVESLEAILMEDVSITRNESGVPELIETTVFPTVGEEVGSQYVCITLQVVPQVGYPDVKPIIKLKNPRGLDDQLINHIEKAVAQKLDNSIGQPVVFDLIDIIREYLTESNLPSGQCVICLYGFQEGDAFTKTACYHYLHSHCLACHLTASKRNYDEELAKMPAWKQKEAKPYQALCPVCREPIDVSIEPLLRCEPPNELANAPNFELTEQLKSLQAQMAKLYLHQKSRGGIIDLSAEENNVIAIESELPQAETTKSVNTQDINLVESTRKLNGVATGGSLPAQERANNSRAQGTSFSGTGGGGRSNTGSSKARNANGPVTTANADESSSVAGGGEGRRHHRYNHGGGGGHKNRRHHHHHHHHQHGHHNRGAGGSSSATNAANGATTASSTAQKNSNSSCASGAR